MKGLRKKGCETSWLSFAQPRGLERTCSPQLTPGRATVALCYCKILTSVLSVCLLNTKHSPFSNLINTDISHRGSPWLWLVFRFAIMTLMYVSESTIFHFICIVFYLNYNILILPDSTQNVITPLFPNVTRSCWIKRSDVWLIVDVLEM